MYTFSSRIRYSEVDKDAYLTLESLIDYFQDCSTFQTQDGPADMEYLRSKNLVWVLSSWQIEINRYPKLCTEVTIGTVPHEIRGFFGVRNFFMDTAEGERLAIANSVWTLVDIQKGIPARVTPEIIEAYPLEEKLPMEYADRKIAIPSDVDACEGEPIEVKNHHLDTNKHVNNGQYIRMATECLKDSDIKVRSLRAEYKKQAVLGDVLYPVIYETSRDGKTVHIVSLNDEQKKPVCVVELI